MKVNVIRNYFSFIIICNNINDANNIIDKLMEKIKVSRELESFNISSKIKYLYLTDSSKIIFISRNHFNKIGYTMRGKIIGGKTFKNIIRRFDPTIENFVDIMSEKMISDLERNNSYE